MLSQQGFEALILLSHFVAFATGVREDLFQAENFLLEGFDVLFFPFAVGAIAVSIVYRQWPRLNSPLCLPIQLLSACHSGLAVWLRSSALRGLSICWTA